jgi:hypothetical protein
MSAAAKTVASDNRYGQPVEITLDDRIADATRVAQVSVTTGGVELCAATNGKPTRTGVWMYNSGSVDVRLCIGNTMATATRWTVLLKVGDQWRSKGCLARITAIVASGTGQVQVTEVV